jgi:hypothetical protein
MTFGTIENQNFRDLAAVRQILVRLGEIMCLL